MKQYIDAIPTEYNGYIFRSRLEARWAVFFDTIGWKYEYEPETFRLDDGRYYLPDFYLPQQDLYVEVKPRTYQYSFYSTFEKAYNLASHKRMLFLLGPPDYVAYGKSVPHGDDHIEIDSVAFLYADAAHENRFFYQVWAGPDCNTLDNLDQENNIGKQLSEEHFSDTAIEAINTARRASFNTPILPGSYDSLKHLNERHRKFVEDRNWQKHQTPKNLVMALTGEVGELVELFQWLTPEESRELSGKRRQAVAEEMADVLIYLVRLADETGIDLVAAAHEKCEINERKYPAEAFQGNDMRPHEYKESK
jgi:NTP pyrophosphatase (non-canonical NTP hydrolase)